MGSQAKTVASLHSCMWVRGSDHCGLLVISEPVLWIEKGLSKFLLLAEEIAETQQCTGFQCDLLWGLPTSCSHILNFKQNAREYFILSLWQHFSSDKKNLSLENANSLIVLFTFHLISSKKLTISDTNGACSPHQHEFSLHCASKDKQRSGDSFTLGTGNAQEAPEQLSKSKH